MEEGKGEKEEGEEIMWMKEMIDFKNFDWQLIDGNAKKIFYEWSIEFRVSPVIW